MNEQIINKEAQTDLDIHILIKKRWSPRAFRDEVPEKKKILKILEAAQWAASSRNEQPWRFIIGVGREDGTYIKLLNCLNKRNQLWAGKAPVLLLACARKSFSGNDSPNRHYMYDTGQALATMALQATADGLFLHQMAGFNPVEAIELFEIPKEFEVVTMAAIGYLGDFEDLDEQFQSSETRLRTRKPMSEVVFIEEWGNPFH